MRLAELTLELHRMVEAASQRLVIGGKSLPIKVLAYSVQISKLELQTVGAVNQPNVEI